MSRTSADMDLRKQCAPSLLLVDQRGLLAQLHELSSRSSTLRFSGPARDAIIKLVINELPDSLVVIDHRSRFAPSLNNPEQTRRWTILTAGADLAAINLLPGPTSESTAWASNATEFLLAQIDHAEGDESPEWQLLNQLLLRSPESGDHSQTNSHQKSDRESDQKSENGNALQDIESAIATMATGQAIKIGALNDEQIIQPAARKKLALSLNRLLLGESLRRWTDGAPLNDIFAEQPKSAFYLPLNHLDTSTKKWASAQLYKSAVQANAQRSGYKASIVVTDKTVGDESLATSHELQLHRPTDGQAKEELASAEADQESPTSDSVLELVCDFIEMPTGRLVRLSTQQQEFLTLPPRTATGGEMSLEALQRLVEANPAKKTEPAALANLLPVAYLPTAVADAENVHYLPGMLIDVELSYQILSLQFQHSRRITALVMLTPSGGSIDEQSLFSSPREWPENLLTAPEQGAAPIETPVMLASHRGIERARRKVSKALTRQEILNVYHCRELGITSEPGISSEDFQDLLRRHSNERHEARLAAIKARFEPRLLHVIHRIRKTDSKVKKQQRKVDGGSLLLRPARYVATKAITSQLNPVSHLPQRRKAKENKPQRELIELEKRLERLKRQHRELQQQYEQDREKQLKLHKAEELEYRRFDIKPAKGGVRLLKIRLCGCPWGSLDQQQAPLYSL